MSNGAIILLAGWLLPCVMVALIVGPRVSFARLVLALFASTVICLLTIVALGVSQFGDCGEDVIGPVPGSACHAAKANMAWTCIAIGAALLVGTNWLLVRHRKR